MTAAEDSDDEKDSGKVKSDISGGAKTEEKTKQKRKKKKKVNFLPLI